MDAKFGVVEELPAERIDMELGVYLRETSITPVTPYE